MKIDTKETVTDDPFYTPQRGHDITEPGVYVPLGDLTEQGVPWPWSQTTRLIVVGWGSLQAKIVKVDNTLEKADGLLDAVWVRVAGLALTITLTNDK